MSSMHRMVDVGCSFLFISSVEHLSPCLAASHSCLIHMVLFLMPDKDCLSSICDSKSFFEFSAQKRSPINLCPIPCCSCTRPSNIKWDAIHTHQHRMFMLTILQAWCKWADFNGAPVESSSKLERSTYLHCTSTCHLHVSFNHTSNQNTKTCTVISRKVDEEKSWDLVKLH